MFPLSPHAKDCYIMPAASLQVGTEAGSQRGSTDPAVWTRLAFGSAELPGILRFDRQSASPSSLRLWKLGRYRIDSCYLHVPAISRSFWKGKQGLPFVSPQSRTWRVTKLTCCKTHPQDSTSQTLFRRSVLSCLFLFGSRLPQTPQALLPAGFGMYLLNSSHQQLQCNSHRHGLQSRAGLLNDFQGRRCGKEKLKRDTNDIKWSRMLKFAA